MRIETLSLAMLVALVGCGDRKASSDRETVSNSATVVAPGDAGSGDAHRVDDGSELVGTRAGPWTLTDWVGSEPLSLADLRGKVVVVRFWTMGCPYCEKSMPALEGLRRELADEPVVFVGAFHAKPIGSTPDMKAPAELAAKWEVGFPIAFDRGWKTLNSWYMDGYHRHATSVTFVIDKQGTIVHIDPGPIFFPSDDPDHADENAAYQAIASAVRSALAR